MDFFSIDKYSKKVEENCKIVYTVYDTYFYNEFKRKRDTINGYDFIEAFLEQKIAKKLIW